MRPHRSTSTWRREPPRETGNEGKVPRKWSEDEAAQWLASDLAAEMLDFPRRIAASIVSIDGNVSRILDIASGPGSFLKVFLEMFPESVGIWHDASDTMRSVAEKELELYASRISWVQGDMYNFAGSALPPGIDVILTSRATHHFTPQELADFYAGIAPLLRSGGWIINLDHAYLGLAWDSIFRSARRDLFPKKRTNDSTGHKHEKAAPEIADHIAALRNAGITEVQTAWQAYYTFLIVARKP